MVSVCGPGELLIIDVRALEVEDSNKETCDFKSRVIGAPPHCSNLKTEQEQGCGLDTVK